MKAKSKNVSLLALLMYMLMTVGFISCGNISSSKTKDFTSNQDVINYCQGKTFSADYFDLSTTVRENDDITVVSFTNTTAIVKVWFDMGPITGRAYKDCLRFKIDKETGRIEQIHE